MTKLILILAALFSLETQAYIQRTPEVLSMETLSWESFETKNEGAYLISTIHSPGKLVLTFHFLENLEKDVSIEIPRGPGSFDNISDINDIGRHNIQWQTVFFGSDKVRMTFTGKKAVVHNLYRWIVEKKTLRPWFENEIKLGSLNNFTWTPKTTSEFTKKARLIHNKYKCQFSRIRNTICPGMEKIPYYRIHHCWDQILDYEWEELYKEMPRLENRDAHVISDSLCLDRSPHIDLRKGLSITAMESLIFDDSIFEVMVPAHIWRKYEILF